jgi:hypothetical protein
MFVRGEFNPDVQGVNRSVKLSKIQTSSATNGHWLWYVSGVKDVIKANRLDSRIGTEYLAELLNWVHYHDTLAQFSILHWRHGPVETTFAQQLDIKGWNGGLDAEELQVSSRALCL